jgi:hypothetical protein
MTAFIPTYTYKYTNIILDMDGTILDNIIRIGNYGQILPQPVQRPRLDEFMDYVFSKFERVSIWTAGTREWFQLCYREVIKKYIPQGKKFDFVLTREDFTLLYPLKPLLFIYNKFPAYNITNTLIVDDNGITYSQNIANAIGIKPFFHDLLTKDQRINDCELIKLIGVLERKLMGEIVPFDILIRLQSENELRPLLLMTEKESVGVLPIEEADEIEKNELKAQMDYDVITGDYGDLYD